MISDWTYDLVNNGEEMLRKHIDPTNSITKLVKLIGSNFILFVDYSYDLAMINSHYVKTIARQFQEMRNKAGLKPWNPVKLIVVTDNKVVQDILNDVKYQNVFFEVTHRKLYVNEEFTNHIVESLFDSTLENTNISLKLVLG